MLPHDRVLRFIRIYLTPSLLLVVLAACKSPAQPSAASRVVPYNEFADLQYYQVSGTNTYALEFYDGSGTLITDIQGEMQKSDSGPVFHVRIFGNKVGPETPKFIWDTEGNAVYYIDMGDADKSKLQVVYDDDQGEHVIPTAGTVDRPFDEEHRAASK
jgi:hypothetical protein